MKCRQVLSLMAICLDPEIFGFLRYVAGLIEVVMLCSMLSGGQKGQSSMDWGPKPGKGSKALFWPILNKASALRTSVTTRASPVAIVKY